MQITTTLNGAIEVVLVGVIASDGAVVCPDARDQTIVRNADGTIQYAQFVEPAWINTSYAGGTYRQTYGYDANGKVTSVSKWTKQP